MELVRDQGRVIGDIFWVGLGTQVQKGEFTSYGFGEDIVRGGLGEPIRSVLSPRPSERD